jgi:hypothetical protein
VNAANYYLSPTGNDANSGSFAAPWRTLSRADNSVDQGDTLFCRGGTYTTGNDYFQVPASANNFVLINYPGEVPVFQTAGAGSSEPFFFGMTSGGQSNVTVEGIQVRPLASMSASSCFRIIDASNVTLRGVVVVGQKRSPTHYTWDWIVNASETANLEITRCDLGGAGEFDSYGSSGWTVLLQQGCSYGYVHENKLGKGVHSVVAIYSGSHHNIVRYNEIRHAIGYGVDTGSGSYDNLIEFNSCQGSDVDLDYVKSPLIVNGDRNIVRYNVGWDSEKHGVANVGGFNSRIYNNVLYNNGWDGFLGSALSGVNSWGGNRVINNVFTANMQTAPRNQYYAELGFFQSWLDRNDGFQRNYIVLDGQNDDPDASFVEGQGLARASWIQANYANWRDNILSPCTLGFARPDSGDFRIARGSCLVDAGEAVTVVTSDGSGTQLPVRDSYPFWVGDEIMLGSPRQLRRVVNLSRNPHTLILDAGITWRAGDPVSLPYSGAAPDLGCFELTAVESFQATQVSGGVELTWQIDAGELPRVSQVRVQRADDASGPYATLNPQPLPATRSMSFTDTGVQAGRGHWYRLLLDTQEGVEVGPRTKLDVSVGTPIGIQEFRVDRTTEGVSLTWRLSREAVQEVLGVDVQRAEALAGPYSTRTPRPLAPQTTTDFLDDTVEAERTYWYRLALSTHDGSVEFGPVVEAAVGRTRTSSEILGALSTLTNAPIEIRYAIGGLRSPMHLGVYDVAGRRIRDLERGFKDPGYYMVTWDALDSTGGRAPAGVYLVVLTVAEARDSKKLVLIR